MADMMINYWAVLGATVASFVLGWIWHGALFQKQWMKLSGMTAASMKKMPLTAGQAMGLGFVVQLVMSYVLAHIVNYMMAATFTDGAQLGFWIWLGFVMPLTAGAWIWEGKPFKLFILNTAYWLLALIISGGILAVWA